MNNESIWIKVLFDFMEQNGDIGKERKIIEPLVNENIRLHSIIKEVREYIKEQLCQGGERETRDLVDGYELLEILDKENI